MIIDSQVHAFAANTPDRPWFTARNHSPLEHVTGDEMVAAMDKVGVDGAVMVSPYSTYGWDPSYTAQVQQAHPGRFAIVSPINPDDPAAPEQVAEWKRIPGAVAVRVMMAFDKNPDTKGISAVLRAAARHGLVVNLQMGGKLDIGTALVDAHPETRFAMDHLGLYQPRSAPAPADAWDPLPKVLELAKRPNAVLKITGACTMSRTGYPFDDIWDPLARIFDAWGFDRCLWGTDWTRTYSILTYQQGVDCFLNSTRLSDSDRKVLMGEACAKCYGWKPAKK